MIEKPATEVDYATGMQSRIRAALKRVADQAGASTRIPIAVPGPQITEAMWKIFSDVPRIPDYDQEMANQRTWCSEVPYVSDEIPPEPEEIGVYVEADPDGVDKVQIELTDREGHPHKILLNVAEAEEFFLAGLAATTFLRSRQDANPS